MSKSFMKRNSTNNIKSKFMIETNKYFKEKPALAKLNLLLKRVLNQDIFKYKDRFIFNYFARCLCLRNKKTLRKHSKPDFYLDKGVKRLR